MYKVKKNCKYKDIQGIRVYFPFVPGKREIDNWTYLKKEQFFRRTPLPEFYYERREEENYDQESNDLSNNTTIISPQKLIAYVSDKMTVLRRNTGLKYCVH